MCVPWELNPQPFALLTQCSTTELQEHFTITVPSSAGTASKELTLKPSPEAVALATAYRKNPTPGRSWPAARVKEEAIARVAAAGGDPSNHQLVLSESALQFGQYRGKSFKWLLSNGIGYLAMVLAMHQREREGGDTTQSIRERRRVREGTSTPAQEDQVLVGFGDFASMCFKDLYEATDSSRKGYGSPNRLLLITFRVQTRSLCFNLD